MTPSKQRPRRKGELWVSAAVMFVLWLFFALILAQVSYGILFFGLRLTFGVLWLFVFSLVAWFIPFQIVRYFGEIRRLSAHQPNQGLVANRPIDPIRGVVSGVAGVLVGGVLCFVSIILSMLIYERIENMPTHNLWLLIYGLAAVVLSVGSGALVAWLSYRGLSKIGDRKC